MGERRHGHCTERTPKEGTHPEEKLSEKKRQRKKESIESGISRTPDKTQPPSSRVRARLHHHCQTHNTKIAFFLLAAQSFATVHIAVHTPQRPNLPLLNSDCGRTKKEENRKEEHPFSFSSKETHQMQLTPPDSLS